MVSRAREILQAVMAKQAAKHAGDPNYAPIVEQRAANLGYLQHGKAPGPLRTERIAIKPDAWPNAGGWLAFYEGRWRKVHMQVKRLYIVYLGEKITIQIDGV